MILQELKSIETSTSQLRKFGYLMSVVFALCAFISFRRQGPWLQTLLAVDIFFIVLSLVWPRGLKWLYQVWMGFAVVAGFAVSNIILTIIFYFLITPLSLVSKIFGKKFLEISFDKAASSTYWKESSEKSAEQQY